MTTSPNTTELQACLDRLRQGDAAAREALLSHSMSRLRLLTRKMLRRFPNVARWEDTDDVLQNVLVRLNRMLANMTVFTVLDYSRLSAIQVRRELIDLARQHGCAGDPAANHATPPDRFRDDQPTRPLDLLADSSLDPSRLADWAAFHEHIDRLPDPERQVFDLLWYQGLTQEEAAELLKVNTRTVRRRWQAARIRLAEELGDHLPE